jgi:hypothetical protein
LTSIGDLAMTRTLLALALASVIGGAWAAPMTYRGTLTDGGRPANGQYDLRLTVLDASGRKALVPPVTLSGVRVIAGHFAVDVDFGLDPTALPEARLATEVRSSGGDFVALGTPTPVAKAVTGSTPWTLDGNAGTDPAVNFIGTTDAQPLVLRTRNAQSLRIEPSGVLTAGLPITANVIAGSRANAVTAGVRGATIGGGGTPTGASDPDFELEGPNRVTDHYGTVAGGYNNRAGNDDSALSNRAFATVGGGLRNVASGSGSTIGGGQANTASGAESTIGGGALNESLGPWATISGGFENRANGLHSAVTGGLRNQALGETSTIIGGNTNTAHGGASTVGGGQANVAIGAFSTIPGGFGNCTGGDRSFAAGTQAKVRFSNASGAPTCPGGTSSGDTNGDEGTFLWADAQAVNFVSTGPNQFAVRAQGGVWFGTAGPVNIPTTAFIATSTGAFLSNGGTWTNASSRTLKTDFAPIDAGAILDRVLALPLSRWQYRNGGAEGQHLGPVAEDFRAAFGLGAADGHSISTVDASGVALAAIQGLNQRLEAENEALKARLAVLERLANACEGR